MQPLFFARIFCHSEKKHYLCTCYGTKLYLDSVLHHCFLDSIGETCVYGRLHGLPCDDGFNVLVIEDSVRNLLGLDWCFGPLARYHEDRREGRRGQRVGAAAESSLCKAVP